MNELKQKFFRTLLPYCPFVGVRLDWPEVNVPAFLRSTETPPEGSVAVLTLRYGEDPKVLGMPDLVIDARGLSATLSIQGARYESFTPWGVARRLLGERAFQGASGTVAHGKVARERAQTDVEGGLVDFNVTGASSRPRLSRGSPRT